MTDDDNSNNESNEEEESSEEESRPISKYVDSGAKVSKKSEDLKEDRETREFNERTARLVQEEREERIRRDEAAKRERSKQKTGFSLKTSTPAPVADKKQDQTPKKQSSAPEDKTKTAKKEKTQTTMDLPQKKPSPIQEKIVKEEPKPKSVPPKSKSMTVVDSRVKNESDSDVQPIQEQQKRKKPPSDSDSVSEVESESKKKKKKLVKGSERSQNHQPNPLEFNDDAKKNLDALVNKINSKTNNIKKDEGDSDATIGSEPEPMFPALSLLSDENQRNIAVYLKNISPSCHNDFMCTISCEINTHIPLKNQPTCKYTMFYKEPRGYEENADHILQMVKEDAGLVDAINEKTEGGNNFISSVTVLTYDEKSRYL